MTGIAGGASAWALRVGVMTDAPDQQVAIFDAPGSNPNPKFLLDFPSIQVIVRGSPDDYTNTYAKIKAVKDVLLGRDAGSVNGDRWDGVTGLGDIIPLGQDEKKRFKFSANYRIILEPASGTHRESL